MGVEIRCASPWLSLSFPRRLQVLSWALNKPGFTETDRILWREVRNADLPKDLDVLDWFNAELAQNGATDSVAFLTSRHIARYKVAKATTGEIEVTAVATVGLSNAERVGTRQPPHPLSYGTINVAVALNSGLTQAGLIEGLSILVQARTAAVIDARIPVEGGVATGTGTDCAAIAAPHGDALYAGLHTEIGEAIGRAVYDAVYAGAIEWKNEQ